jgi:hypothetical protein
MMQQEGQRDGSHVQTKANKSIHSFVFASWFVKMFGQERLRTGLVLDVGGGKGDFSFEMCVRFGIASTLIDCRDRVVKLSSMQRRRMKRICKSRASKTSDMEAVHESAYSDHSDDRDPLMQWLRSKADLSFDDDLVMLERVQASLVDNKLLPFDYRHMSFPIHFCGSCDSGLLELISGASAIVGIHADQITESIIDHALLFDKPFAVIPCCLFSCLFPPRFLKGGSIVVSSYEDFIQYLLEKDRTICKTVLPFEGRNIVLYRVPVRC